jgi:three-Cys-motif partner protein
MEFDRQGYCHRFTLAVVFAPSGSRRGPGNCGKEWFLLRRGAPMKKKVCIPRKRKINVAADEPWLLELPEAPVTEIKLSNLRHPIWTENKAKLIERYLYYFVLITKHGTYIDGFAGPQELEKSEMWAAKLVLESEPRWMRHFHLFELDKKKVQMLEDLKYSQPAHNKAKGEPKRDIKIYSGDFNHRIHDLLRSGSIGQKEATFCLLDQRTFECRWDSVKALAEYKVSGNKIELFYFFMNAWLGRAFAAQKDKTELDAWWGNDGWKVLPEMKPFRRAELLAERFKKELGYVSVKPWPIYSREDGGRTMYYMIHASDHLEAPKLMYRAYHKAVLPKENYRQLLLGYD